jgi:predicted PurR-regulated permease PerM
LNRRFHLPRGVAAAIGVTVVMLLSVLSLLSLCALLIRELGSLTGILPDLENATLAGLDSLERWLLSLTQKAPENIRSIRPGAGMHTKHYEEVLGQVAKCDIVRGTPMDWKYIK